MDRPVTILAVVLGLAVLVLAGMLWQARQTMQQDVHHQVLRESKVARQDIDERLDRVERAIISLSEAREVLKAMDDRPSAAERDG